MKKILIAMLFMLPALARAEQKPAPAPADYNITVHVQSSQVKVPPGLQPMQYLKVVIDGKKYLLVAWPADDVLPVGNYKARIIKDRIAPDHEYSREYELKFADGTTRKYSVVGEFE
jgi:hypothetical protein